jgi:hypothetical protein
MLKKSFLFATLLLSTAFSTINAEETAGKVADATTEEATDSVQARPARRFFMEIQAVQSQLSQRSVEIKFVAGDIFHTLTRTKPADLQNFRDQHQIKYLVDALNTMSMLGWELHDCYTTASNGTCTSHWVISKEITDTEQLTEGILTKNNH